MKRIIYFILILFFYSCIISNETDNTATEVQGKLFFSVESSKLLGNSLFLDTDFKFISPLNLFIKKDKLNPISARGISYKYSTKPDINNIKGISIQNDAFVISPNVGVLSENFSIEAIPSDGDYTGVVKGNLEIIIRKALTINLEFLSTLDYNYEDDFFIKNISDFIYIGENKMTKEELEEFDISFSVGSLSEGALKLTLNEINNNSSFQIKVASKKIKDLKAEKSYKLPSSFYFEEANYYVGAKNISMSDADIVIEDFSTQYDYSIYLKESSFLDASGLFTLKGIKSSSTFKGNMKFFEEKITGLKNYQPNYVAVIRKEKTDDSKEQLLGIYSFVTGAKLYWDATVPFIATSEEGKWINISSSGGDYSGVIGSNGEDFKYNYSNKSFNNDDDNRNIQFKEIDDIKALFLVAEIDHNFSFLAGHNSRAGWQYFHPEANTPNLVLIHKNVKDEWDTLGNYWIGKNEVVKNSFNIDKDEILSYGFWTPANNTGLKANQTKGDSTGADRVWKGKFQKYLIFDQNDITKTDVQRIANYLDTNSKEINN